jgi:DNA adenine methylase
MGSKRRIADEILPIILKGRKSNQYYVEPFCGGCNTLERVDGKRIGGDIHTDLIAMYKALQSGWVPPKKINEEEYKRIMRSGASYLKGYAGFTHSFGGKYGSTYRRGDVIKGKTNKGNYVNIDNVGRVAFDSVMKLLKNVIGVSFYNCNYYDLVIPEGSIIYCDPPYEDTTSYEVAKFPHDNFWEWCRAIKDEGNTIFVSEYKAPEDFKVVWSKDLKTYLNNNSGESFKVTEKLFTL